jgi:hypothetical protein
MDDKAYGSLRLAIASVTRAAESPIQLNSFEMCWSWVAAEVSKVMDAFR